MTSTAPERRGAPPWRAPTPRRWLANEISRRYRPTWFERDTAMFLAMALDGYADRLDDQEAKTLNFTVTAFNDGGTANVIAAAENIEVALAAYNAAIPKQSRGRLVLHQSSRIIAQHPPNPTTQLLPAP